MSSKFLPSFFIFLILLLSLFFFLHSDYFTIYSAGIGLMERDARYQVTTSEINESVSCSIDLENIETNIGKIVYNDGQCQIKISNIIKENDNFKIFFDARGSYNYYGGTLITLLSHDSDSADGYIRTKVGEATYDVTHWYSRAQSYYPNGDVFGYSLFPTQCYKNETLLIKQQLAKHNNTVVVELLGLKKISWERL